MGGCISNTSIDTDTNRSCDYEKYLRDQLLPHIKLPPLINIIMDYAMTVTGNVVGL